MCFDPKTFSAYGRDGEILKVELIESDEDIVLKEKKNWKFLLSVVGLNEDKKKRRSTSIVLIDWMACRIFPRYNLIIRNIQICLMKNDDEKRKTKKGITFFGFFSSVLFSSSFHKREERKQKVQTKTKRKREARYKNKWEQQLTQRKSAQFWL